jgi:hypothetical protein
MRTSQWPVFLLHGPKGTLRYVMLPNSTAGDKGVLYLKLRCRFYPSDTRRPKGAETCRELILPLKVSGFQLAFLIFHLGRPLYGS